LKQKAVAYINSDGNGRGYLWVGGSHSLEKFVNGVARDIQDPETKMSVWKRSQLRRIKDASKPEDRTKVRQRTDWTISALGSGSDYTAFIDHLGVASMNLGYGGEDGGGIYHSIYDDFYWYTHFSDTDFSYGRALAQTAGTAVIRLADADVLPFDFKAVAESVENYVDEVKELLKKMQDDIRERNKEISEGVFTATADPKKVYVPPAVEEVPPYLNFAPVENASDSLTRSSDRYTTALKKVQEGSVKSPTGYTFKALNLKLIQSERRLTDSTGLPGRPWFKHMIYAPGAYTGYGVKTLPGVREAIEQKKWTEAESEISRVARTIENEAALIDSAATELGKAVESNEW
jgi:N-acetylated-alpha-linked acidic dipeptidase